MIVSEEKKVLVHDMKISSVGPGHVSGADLAHYPSDVDLAMKLHYFKAVYLFNNQTQKLLTISNIKEKMFNWFDYYFIPCGRFRRSQEISGRPFIKCNDCGARFIEAKCSITIHEWLQIKDSTPYILLTPQQVLGPDLSYSPPLLFQLTQFKCGGYSMAMSWAHVLGDPFTASEFINSWGLLMSGLPKLNFPSTVPKSTPTVNETSNGLTSLQMEPISANRVEPVGDHWIIPSNLKMDSLSLYITSAIFNHIKTETWGTRNHPTPDFETLCAIIWQCIAKVRKDHEDRVVTVCKYDSLKPTSTHPLGNNQVIAKVEAEFSVGDAELKELATLLVDKAVDERAKIGAAVSKDQGATDFCVYGAKLTFVDLGEADLYGLELNGQKPEFVYCNIQGVGDEGVVLVLPWPKGGVEGRLVTVTLAEDDLLKLKVELKQRGLLHESE